jgi:hypothetical protein
MLYQPLDPTNYTKTLRQLMVMLYTLGCDADVEIEERAPQAAS